MNADLVLTGGRVAAMDPHPGEATAVAVAGRRILAVGADDEIAPLAGPKTRRIDLDGRLVVPGFIDSHFHFYDWTMTRLDQDLSGTKSLAHLLAVLAEAVRHHVPGSWIVGQGFNETDWDNGRLPTRDDLDLASPAHPVIVWRCDLHLAVANSAALHAAGITHTTPNPEAGVIARDDSGRATGILRETAINLVKEAIPPLSEEDLAAAMLDAQAELHSYGVTGLCDARLKGEWAAPVITGQWQRLDQAGTLALRTWVGLPGERLEECAALGLRSGFGSDRLRLGHLKFFADGGMGARTAWLLDGFLDAGYGMCLTPPEEIARALVAADRAGLACMVHAVGDRAAREVIDAFEELARQRRALDEAGRSAPAVSHRIDHLQMVRPEDLERLASLPVAVGMQPSNMVLDINLINECLGDDGRYTYAFGSVAASGVELVFNSDCPVSDPRPVRGIHALTTRTRPDGTPKGGWYPEQRIDVAAALAGYTSVPARTLGREGDLGSVTPGKLADLCVLDTDILSCDPAAIAHARAELTVFDGTIVFERSGNQAPDNPKGRTP